MSTRKSNVQPLSRLINRIALCVFLGCLLMLRLARGQALQRQPNEPTELDTALARANSGNADGRDVVVIADAKALQAIPALEQQFKRSADLDTKVSIASGLVKLRDSDDTYWKFLLEQAALAVDSGVPDLAYSESQVKGTNRSPELEAWAKARDISVDTAGRYARYDFPGKVLQLAMAGDPRGAPLLRRALQSRNYLIVTWAAKGLAEIQDRESIPLIIAAIRRAPTGYAPVIAESLAFFDDAQAQSTVDAFVPQENARMIREAKASGVGVFGP